MERLQEWLELAGKEMGVSVIAPFNLVLSSGKELQVPALVAGIGGREGMLIVTSFNDIRDYVDELVSAGYGYSTLSEPEPNEKLDIDAFKEMFRDWGWKG